MVSPWGAPHSARSARTTNLAKAANHGSVDAALELIQNGADLNTVDDDGNTALHWAAWFNLDTLAEKLISKGCDPKIQNQWGEIAAHWAAKCSNTHVLNLLKHDISLLSARDMDGFTLLIISAQNDNIGIMEWLYLRGVSVEEQDNLGRTALHWACYKGRRKAVQWLLSRAALVAHRDHDGTTAIHWAALKGHDVISEMLIDVGAARLLSVPDSTGDTPIALASRKKHNYLTYCFYKTRILQCLIGRPYFAQNSYAVLFLCLLFWNFAIVSYVIIPVISRTIYGQNLTYLWLGLNLLMIILWFMTALANPGWLSPQTILSQDDRIGPCPEESFDAMQPIESQMVHAQQGWGRPLTETSVQRLQKLERDLQKFDFQRHILLEATRMLKNESKSILKDEPFKFSVNVRQHFPEFGSQEATLEEQAEQLEVANGLLLQRLTKTAVETAECRVDALEAQGLEDYVRFVKDGLFNKVCVICRAVREMRSHHCKECGRCVSRADHHCPWVNNCIGVGNQRQFALFIFTLFIVIAVFYCMLFQYMKMMYQSNHGGFMTLIPPRVSIEAFASNILLAITATINFIWLGFSFALIIRTISYMLVNVTTYEVITQPSHIKKRFTDTTQSRFWFFQDCRFVSLFRNCYTFWTSTSYYDEEDFDIRQLDGHPLSEVRRGRNRIAPILGYERARTRELVSPV